MQRLLAIREATTEILPMKRMMHLCFDAGEVEFKHALERLKSKAQK